MKKITKKITETGSSGVKRILSKSKYVKSFAEDIASFDNMPVLPDVGSRYNAWVQKNMPDYMQLYKLKEAQTSFQYRPMISVLLEVTYCEDQLLRESIDSLLGQVYEEWQLNIIYNTSVKSRTKEIIEQYALRDKRITATCYKQHISTSVINKSVESSVGDYITFYEQGDILWPNALHEIVAALNIDKEIDWLYSDEDKITQDRHYHLVPFFKPDWNPELLYSMNYAKHLYVVKKSIYLDIGGMRKKYDGARYWDLVLRVADRTSNVFHIPKILYSERLYESNKSRDRSVIDMEQRLINDVVSRHKDIKMIVTQDTLHPDYLRVDCAPKNQPLVSIVIPSKNQYKIINQCLESIYTKSTYTNFEIILVDTGSDDRRVLSLYKTIQARHDNFTVVDFTEKPFSYSRSCNEGVRKANGDVVIMLNNDTEVITPEWIELLSGEAQGDNIGAVGCMLLYPGGQQQIQHAGVGVGLGGTAANLLQGVSLTQPLSRTQYIYANTRHNITAVTAACMAIRKSVFNEVGGFDENYRITYNDVDLCLRITENGYRNIYTPYVQLIHHESVSLGLPSDASKRDIVEYEDAKVRFKARWDGYIHHDPNLNPNMVKENAFLNLP